jgi:hypothetical protein
MRTNRDELFTLLKQGTVAEGLKHNERIIVQMKNGN